MEDLTIDELKVSGGSWSGLLFENSATKYPLTLSWTFTVEFEPLSREYGDVTPSLTVDWVPAEGRGWKDMAGCRFACHTFGEPVESSLYFFDHFRFDQADVSTEERPSHDLGVSVVVSGDIDGLGLSEVSAQAVLGFRGIYVQTDEAGVDSAAAAEVLARFSDLEGLVARPQGHNVVFEVP